MFIAIEDKVSKKYRKFMHVVSAAIMLSKTLLYVDHVGYGHGIVCKY